MERSGRTRKGSAIAKGKFRACSRVFTFFALQFWGHVRDRGVVLLFSFVPYAVSSAARFRARLEDCSCGAAEIGGPKRDRGVILAFLALSSVMYYAVGLRK